MKWSDRLKVLSPHGTAAATYLLIFGIVPALAMGLLGATELIVWGLAGSPHAWGVSCLWFFFFPAIPLFIVLSMFGIVVLLVTGLLSLLRRWLKFSRWVPAVLAFPASLALVREPGWANVTIALLASTAFAVYWLAFSFHGVIVARSRKKLAMIGLAGVVVLLLLVSACFLTSFHRAKQTLDADLARTGHGAYKCKRAGFILDFQPSGIMDCQPCWVFRYEVPSTGAGLRRIYVSIPDHQIWQTRIGLDPSPVFGVLP